MREKMYRPFALLMLGSASFLLVFASLIGAQESKVPEKLVFEAALGAVTFDHAQHVEAAGGNCAACHDKLWPQDAQAPLGYKARMHRTAEEAKSSCAACHHPDGPSFATKGNCKTCHVKE